MYIVVYGGNEMCGPCEGAGNGCDAGGGRKGGRCGVGGARGGRDVGKGTGAGGRGMGGMSGVDGTRVGRDAGKGPDSDAGGSCVGGGSALRTIAVQARALAAAERASGFARFPDCSPAPYGSSSTARLRLGTLMCWAISELSTLPRWRFFPQFSPIRAVVSGQLC